MRDILDIVWFLKGTIHFKQEPCNGFYVEQSVVVFERCALARYRSIHYEPDAPQDDR